MEKNNITLRPAQLKDLETLLDFEQGVISYERAFTTSLKEDPITYYDIKQLIENDDAQMLVAICDGQVVGSGYALIKKNKPYKVNSTYAYLGFMYVTPSHRGKGINGMITEGLLKWSKSRGIQTVQLDVYADNTSAIQAYSKKGFTPNLLNMTMMIT